MDGWMGYTCAYPCVVLLSLSSIREKSGDRAGSLLQSKASFHGRRNFRACAYVCFGSPTHSICPGKERGDAVGWTSRVGSESQLHHDHFPQRSTPTEIEVKMDMNVGLEGRGIHPGRWQTYFTLCVKRRRGIYIRTYTFPPSGYFR